MIVKHMKQKKILCTKKKRNRNTVEVAAQKKYKDKNQPVSIITKEEHTTGLKRNVSFFHTVIKSPEKHSKSLSNRINLSHGYCFFEENKQKKYIIVSLCIKTIASLLS
jgi:hypothetical protein